MATLRLLQPDGSLSTITMSELEEEKVQIPRTRAGVVAHKSMHVVLIEVAHVGKAITTNNFSILAVI